MTDTNADACRILRTSIADLGAEALLCPICGFEYVHPAAIEVSTGNYHIRIDSNGLKLVNAETAETREARCKRGVRIYFEYVCENGHHGFIILQFRKGNLLIEHEELEPTNKFEVIWRD